ncbi:unnamed protein product, partial [Ectocarpus sp. 4 AP-2014]
MMAVCVSFTFCGLFRSQALFLGCATLSIRSCFLRRNSHPVPHRKVPWVCCSMAPLLPRPWFSSSFLRIFSPSTPPYFLHSAFVIFRPREIDLLLDGCSCCSPVCRCLCWLRQS